ncbi:MAG: response regulator [Chitinophagaceae bacterium]
MNPNQLHLFLADDDYDDCILFREALDQLPFSTRLTQFHYGDQLMQWLKQTSGDLPDALFLDLNMPRKSGFQCLAEIRQNEKLKLLPIFIISTSYEKEIADLLYKNGATFYIRKPTDFEKLKKLINQALSLLTKNSSAQPSKEKFVLTAN